MCHLPYNTKLCTELKFGIVQRAEKYNKNIQNPQSIDNTDKCFFVCPIFLNIKKHEIFLFIDSVCIDAFFSCRNT